MTNATATPATLIADLNAATREIPAAACRVNGPAWRRAGASASVSNVSDAIAWSLANVRAARTGNARELAYTGTWVASYGRSLEIIAPGFAAELLATTNGAATVAELEEIDEALCDFAEKMNGLRGCGGYYMMIDGRNTRVTYRPAPFAAYVASKAA